MTAAQRHREDVFRRNADEYERVTCYFADEGDCRGRLQAAHIIAAKVLKRTYSAFYEFVADYGLEHVVENARSAA